MRKTLRPHQIRALDMLRESLRSGKKRPLIQAPTGFGKTVVATAIIEGAIAKSKRVVFTVPALSLVEQTVAAFAAEGIECVGVMQGYHPLTDSSQPVQVCSVQTLARRQIPNADIVIVDEAHRMFKSVNEWIADPEWSGVPFVGLSATPWSRGLGKYYDDLLIPAGLQELIDAGYLAPFVVYAPSAADVSGIAVRNGDFDQAALSDRFDREEIVGDIVAEWVKRGEGRPTLAYGIDRAHAEHIQQRFLEAEVEAAYIDCNTDNAERERIFRSFRAGETRVICNVGCLTTGVDLPMVGCIIDAHPTLSEMLFVQTIGRGLRTAEGKTDLIVLDHAGNTQRLGLVTQIKHDRLSDEPVGADKKDKLRVETVRLCDECKAVLPPSAKVCPQCGHIIEAKSAARVKDGELVPLGSKEKSAPPSYQIKERFLAELKHYAQVKGYAPGWAAHKFKERYGHWPDGFMKHVEPVEPSLMTSQWIRSRAIAYAKGRARHG